MTKEATGLVTSLLKQGKSYRDLFNQVIVPVQPKGSKPPFFCVHGGPGRSIFFPLAKALGSEQPFYAVQSVGLDGKEAPLITIDEMAERYLKEIRKIQPSGPYFFGGYCMGGAVAVEMARTLLAKGERVALVAMLDTHAPWRVRETKESSPYSLSTRLKSHWNNIRRMPRNEIPEYLRLRVEHVNFIIRRLLWELGYSVYRFMGKPLPKFLHDINSINTHAYMAYKGQPYPGKLTLIVTTGTAERFKDAKLGWEGVARDGLDVYSIPGLHDNILTDAYIRPCGQQLRQSIAEASRAEAVATW